MSTLFAALCDRVRQDMSLCGCPVPVQCAECAAREALLTQAGYWSDPAEAVIPGEAPVAVEWEAARVTHGVFRDGCLRVRVGVVTFVCGYDTASNLSAALAEAVPSQLSRDLEASLRAAVAKNRPPHAVAQLVAPSKMVRS